MKYVVNVPEPATKSQSRKVNKYVQRILIERALSRASAQVASEVSSVLRTLTGGQLAEAWAILREATDGQ